MANRPTRAALLPTTGDPYACALFLDKYRKHWKSEVDSLLVFINGRMPDDVFDYVVEMFEKENALVHFVRDRAGHGKPLDALIKTATEDQLFLVEDDFYVLNEGIVDGWFNAISGEAHNAIGSMRGCCSAELIQKEAEVFGLSGKEALQPNFWPCLYLGARQSLQALKHTSGPRHWKAGDHIPELNYTVPFDMAGDTFVSASIELRGQGLKIHQVDQHRLIDVTISHNISPGWVHIGSCANALVELTTEEGVQLGALGNSGIRPDKTKKKNKINIPDEGIRALYEERAAMWQLIKDSYPIPASCPGSWLNTEWNQGIQRMVKSGNLNLRNIAAKKQHLRTLLKL